MTTSRCLAWYLNDSKMQYYMEGGPKFYPPMRCPELCVGSENLCAGHLRKKQNPQANMNKNRSGAFWGLVTEPIRDFENGKNYIAFGPWFMEKAKQYPLSEDSMRKLKTLHAAAVDNTVAVAVAVPDVPAVAVAVAEDISKKKASGAGRKKKEIVVTAAVATPAPAATPTPAEPKKKRAPKKALTENPPPIPISGILLNSAPLQLEDFVEVPVRAFEHDGTLYYLDPKKSKLYDRAQNGSTKGIYKGRWDSNTESIVRSLPDSDCE